MLVPLQSRKGSSLKTWCGSSVGLEYRPVTPGVASSSLVRTAQRVPKLGFGTLFAFNTVAT